MQTVHGNHHRYRVSQQSYKESLKRRQSQLLLETVPQDEYVVTETGQYRCALCTNIPPFKNGSDLVAHLRGKRHQGRILNKKLQQTVSLERKVTGASIAIPDILYRTQEVTKRVLASNHETAKRPEINPPDVHPSPELPTPQSGNVPQWIQDLKDKKEEEAMLAKGFRKCFCLVLLMSRDENGRWYRDTTIEFDSDEEPTLEQLVP